MVDDLCRQGVRPATIVDVGANVGQFTHATLHLLKPRKVHAFEALPKPLSSSIATFGTNPMSAFNPLRKERRAVKLSLHISAHSPSSSVLPLGDRHRAALPEATTVADVTVPMRTLDGALCDVDLIDRLLLKVDVQGYEPWVLDGGPRTLARAESIVLELYFVALYSGEPVFLDLVACMSAYGFGFVRPVGWLSDSSTGEVLQCDELFQRTRPGTL